MRNREIHRRDTLRASATAAAALWAAPLQAFASETPESATDVKQACTLGFSTYGMKTLRTEAAVQAVAKCGYDAIELAVRADWDSAPARMSRERRVEVRRLLNNEGLHLSSLMEHLLPSDSDKEHAMQLDRLASVFDLAHDLAPNQPPLVQTVLGGGQWKQRREFLRDRLADWLKLAEQHKMVVAIKPHRGGGMSEPSEANWLIEQLGRPQWLRMVYDYSHYAFRDLPFDETIATALPYTAHVAVKDPVQQGERVVFQLPGEAGTIDYASLIRQFHAGGYRGDFSCEVSGMVWGKPNYDPLAAAKQCYQAMAKAFKESGVPRSNSGQ